MTKVRLLSELSKHDVVRTPSGKIAAVIALNGVVTLRVMETGEEMTLQPHLLELVQKAPRHDVPAKFFKGDDEKAVAT